MEVVRWRIGARRSPGGLLRFVFRTLVFCKKSCLALYRRVKNRVMKRILFWLLLPLLVGCSHTVKYKLDESDRWTGPKINAVVYVKPFADQAPLATNKV